MSKQSAYFKVPGLSNQHEVKKIKQALDSISGVLSVSANTREDKVAVDYDSSATNTSVLKNELNGIGIHAELISNQDHIM